MAKSEGVRAAGRALAAVPTDGAPLAKPDAGPDLDGTSSGIDDARERLGRLTRDEYNQPGDRQRVGEALTAAHRALASAAGLLEEARGISRRVDRERLS